MTRGSLFIYQAKRIKDEQTFDTKESFFAKISKFFKGF